LSFVQHGPDVNVLFFSSYIKNISDVFAFFACKAEYISVLHVY